MAERRFAGGRRDAGVAFEIELAAGQLGAVELHPRPGETLDDGVEQALGEGPVDVGQVALGRSLRGLASKQAFERLQQEGQLDAQQQGPLGAALLHGHGERVGREADPGRRPHVLRDIPDRDLDLGLELVRELLGESIGERGQRGASDACGCRS